MPDLPCRIRILTRTRGNTVDKRKGDLYKSPYSNVGWPRGSMSDYDTDIPVTLDELLGD